MEEDRRLSVWRPTKLLGHALVGGLFGLVCAVVPFSIGLSRTNVRLSAVPKLPSGAEDPVRLGIKALIWGSVYSVSGVGALTFGVCWLLDVKSVSLLTNNCHFYAIYTFSSMILVNACKKFFHLELTKFDKLFLRSNVELYHQAVRMNVYHQRDNNNNSIIYYKLSILLWSRYFS